MSTASAIVAELDRLYSASVTRLQAALTAYLTDRTVPDAAARRDGAITWPAGVAPVNSYSSPGVVWSTSPAEQAASEASSKRPATAASNRCGGDG